MVEAGVIIGVAVAVVVILIIIITCFCLSCFVVHQAEGIVIERLGKFNRVLDSGLNFVVPIIDRPRQFTWRKTEISTGHSGVSSISDQLTSSTRIDLRESVFNFLPQEVYTKDTVLLDVNALMFYSIFNVKKAIYEVDDLQGALSNTAQTQLKEVFGNMTFSEALESQTRINDHLANEFSKLFYDWGIRVERMELLDLSPKHNVREQMKKQMIAERTRRGDFIRSEGKKAAMRLEAEGKRLVSVNMGLAEQEATRKTSEGESTARVERIRAESTALDLVASAVTHDGATQTDYMIGQKYIALLGSLTSKANKTTLFMPWEAGSCQGIVSDLSSVFGASAPRTKVEGQGPLPPKPRVPDSDTDEDDDNDVVSTDDDSDPDADADDEKIGGFADLD